MRRRRSGVTSNAERSEISGQAVPSIDRLRRDDQRSILMVGGAPRTLAGTRRRAGLLEKVQRAPPAPADHAHAVGEQDLPSRPENGRTPRQALGSRAAVALTTADFCASIRKRSSKVAHAYFRRPAGPRRTRSAPPASPAPPQGSPAPAPAAPSGRPLPGGWPTPACCAADPRRARRNSRPDSRCRPAPRARRFQRQLHNVRFASAFRTPPVRFNGRPSAKSGRGPPSSSSSALAFLRSGMSKPSMNQL
jgi:hypothetical protein